MTHDSWMRGTLALVGSGEYLDSMNDVDRALLARIDGDPRVVCLATAAGKEGDAVIDRWSSMGVAHFEALGAQAEAVRVTDRPSAMDEAHAARIREANFVYLSGGSPPYLYETLVGTPVWDAIAGVLAAGGVVAGCSAGAMIWGRRSTPLVWHGGFGYMPDALVLPHFDETPGWIVSLLRSTIRPGLTVLGVDGNTALTAHEGQFSVVGKGRVVVVRPFSRKTYSDGDAVEWV